MKKIISIITIVVVCAYMGVIVVLATNVRNNIFKRYSNGGRRAE